jgi:hypothetical protein
MKTVEEKKRIIAEFECLDKSDSEVLLPKRGWFVDDNLHKNDWGSKKMSALKYDTSFDWLMPVVKKIEELGYYFEMTTHTVGIKKDRNSSMAIWGENFKEHDTKEQALFETVFRVIEAINMKNETTNKLLYDKP